MTYEDDLPSWRALARDRLGYWKAERERRIDAEQKLTALQDEVNELWPCRKRAEKAERERDEARAERDSWRAQVPLAEWEKELVQHSEQSRPLTPDAITDAMIERGAVANWRGDVAHPDWTFEDISDEDRGWYRDNARAVLTAALTEPPARHEGAEDIEVLLFDVGVDENRAEVANYLAARLTDPTRKEA